MNTPAHCLRLQPFAVASFAAVSPHLLLDAPCLIPGEEAKHDRKHGPNAHFNGNPSQFVRFRGSIALRGEQQPDCPKDASGASLRGGEREQSSSPRVHLASFCIKLRPGLQAGSTARARLPAGRLPPRPAMLPGRRLLPYAAPGACWPGLI